MKRPKIGIISLGCPRNLVDSELMLGKLAAKKYIISDSIEGSDVAIINTCAFVEDAKREAIDIILKAAQLKKEGSIKKLIVTGCMGQRYAKVLKKDIPEVDAILGIDNFKNIEKAIQTVFDDKRFLSVNSPKGLYDHKDPRLLITPPHSVYVKIAEGCDNRCSYCAIYKIRGDFRSRQINSIITEITQLSKNKKLPELNLIAQDTTSYGMDNYKKLSLPLLLKEICNLKQVHWLRLLYTHPKRFAESLIDTIAGESSICKYIDLPIQHINDRILGRMNRKTKRVEIERLIYKIRKRIPEVALRTSIIVGFPSETDKEFHELLEFIKEIRFERLGCFIFSKEEDTPAYKFKRQKSDRIKRERFNRVMQLQQEISKNINENFINKRLEVLIEGRDKSRKGLYIGRTQYDAPEVDGGVFVHSSKRLKPGQFVDVDITDTLEYDLVGVLR